MLPILAVKWVGNHNTSTCSILLNLMLLSRHWSAETALEGVNMYQSSYNPVAQMSKDTHNTTVNWKQYSIHKRHTWKVSGCIVPNQILSCQVGGDNYQLSSRKTEEWSPQIGWHSQSTITLEHIAMVPMAMHNYGTQTRVKGIHTGNRQHRKKSSTLKSMSMAHLAPWLK